MAPKVQGKTKAEKEKRSQKMEDKTFGLKNKNKSTKVKRFVDEMQHQKNAEPGGAPRRKKEVPVVDEYKAIIIQQKVPFGQDPKTILCAHYKAGKCTKSNCKFSHDLSVGRKTVKPNLYQDAREDKIKDTMETWDLQKLELVTRENEKDNENKQTEIVCKFFIESIEQQKYGDCKYRHALPPGFVLKKKETEQERKDRIQMEKDNAITIEDFLEKERLNLGQNTTRVTEDTFKLWKETRNLKRQKHEAEQALKKQEEFKKQKQGMKTGMIFSGRDLFEFNPEWAEQGDDAAMDEYERQASDHDDQVPEQQAVDAELFGQVDGLSSDDEDQTIQVDE